MIPQLGLGTYRLQGDVVFASVSKALELGYRAIDTAQIYGNEADIGRALAASGVSRDELFITTKIWVDRLSRECLLPSLQDSLARLGTDYVDLTLIHWPSPGGAVSLAESLDALQDARRRGLTREIGVSNFTIALCEEAVRLTGEGILATNQVELHPYLQNRALLGYARQRGLHLTSYMTLGSGRLLQDPVIGDIASRHAATPAQVCLAWAMGLGCAVIPASTRTGNLESNLRSTAVRLTDEDRIRIAGLDRGMRFANPEGLAPAWD